MVPESSLEELVEPRWMTGNKVLIALDHVGCFAVSDIRLAIRAGDARVSGVSSLASL